MWTPLKVVFLSKWSDLILQFLNIVFAESYDTKRMRSHACQANQGRTFTWKWDVCKNDLYWR